MSHVVPSNQVDSQGGDCTDPETHSVRVLVTGGGTGGGGGGGGALTEQTFSHPYTAPGDDTFVIDVSTFNTLSVAWGVGTTNHDGAIAVYLSNDGGVTWGPWFFSSTAAEEARAQIPTFQYYRTMPAFINVAGIDRVQFRSAGGFTFGTGVLFVRASTGRMWLPTQGTYIMDGRGGSIAFVDDGRLEVNVMNTVESRKISWGLAQPPTSATVTATSSQIVAGSARNGLVLSNLSPTEPVFIGFSTPAVLNSGIAIMPRERFDMSDREAGQAINAIAATTVTVAIQEFS